MTERLALQHELVQLTPMPGDDLEQAANVLVQFGKPWERLKEDLSWSNVNWDFASGE